MFTPPNQPLSVALYDQELGERDMLQVNAHTGKELSANPWISFCREAINEPIALYTDRCLERVKSSGHSVNIAWLLESPRLMKKPLRQLKSLERYFDRILTAHQPFLARGHPYQMCPTGGSWIAHDNWSLYPKTKNLSIIASTKRFLPGHKLRFSAVKRYSNDIDGLFGYAYERIDQKLEGLKKFRFSFAIENCREDYYFTEKLIDCFATGTIPIYWGCPSIGRFFDMDGIIAFEKLNELDRILPQLNESFYNERISAVENNFKKAMAYQMIEKNLYAAINGWSYEGSSVH